MLKAVLFDLDDTLLDWSGFSDEWPNFERKFLRRVFDFLATTDHPLPDFETFATDFRTRMRDAWDSGRGTLVAPNLGVVLLQAVEAAGVPVGRHEARALLEAYQWTAVPGTVLFPEVPEVLMLLRDNGIKIAIVTNAGQPMWVRDLEIDAHGLLQHFPDVRISAADIGYLKPHPAIFQAALDALGVTTEEAIFIGDNPVADVAGAQGVGMRAILRIISPAQPMLSGLIVPDAAINSLTELPPILDEWFPGWRKDTTA